MIAGIIGEERAAVEIKRCRGPGRSKGRFWPEGRPSIYPDGKSLGKMVERGKKSSHTQQRKRGDTCGPTISLTNHFLIRIRSPRKKATGAGAKKENSAPARRLNRWKVKGRIKFKKNAWTRETGNRTKYPSRGPLRTYYAWEITHQAEKKNDRKSKKKGGGARVPFSPPAMLRENG